MNRLFVAYKPTNIGSNSYLSRLKRKYNQKKAGFTGTLDPFASGVLVVGFGAHTKLFRFLDKTPKTYLATLWLGAHSKSLDLELIEQIDTTKPLPLEKVQEAVQSLQGTLTYTPPIFSAKKIDGKRAYDLARNGEEVNLRTITSTIHTIKLHAYCHPFVTFEATVSEGTYIRSLGKMIAEKLNIQNAALSSLTRVQEGKFIYENEKPLDIKTALAIPQNFYLGEKENMLLGKPLKQEDFQIQEEGYYWIDNHDTITIINIMNDCIKYELNKVAIC